MRLVFAASAIVVSLVPHLSASAIIQSVKADAGEYLTFPPYGTLMYPCSGNGITQYGCNGPQAASYGTANVNFVGGSMAAFETSGLSMSQLYYSYGGIGIADIYTVAGFTAYGLATGGTGTGTWTYDIQISDPCVADTICSTGWVPPQRIGGGASVPCPIQAVILQCYEGTVNFTFGVPFPVTFQISFAGGGGIYQNTIASQGLSFYNMAVTGTGTDLEFSLVAPPDVPEPGTFGIGLLGLCSTMGLIAFRKRRYISYRRMKSHQTRAFSENQRIQSVPGKARSRNIFRYSCGSRLARRGEGWAPYPRAATPLQGIGKGTSGAFWQESVAGAWTEA